MSKNQSAFLPKEGLSGAQCTISTANPNLDGTGTLGTVVTGGADGSYVDYVTIQAIGTVTNGMIRLFLTEGATTKLIFEIAVTAATPSGTVPAFRATWSPSRALFLKDSTCALKVSTHNAESFNVRADGGSY